MLLHVKVLSVAVPVLCLFSFKRHGAHGAWWRDSHLAERILNPRAYNQSLAHAESMLPLLKANGYSVVNLDWPVESGPVVLYGGFAARDYMKVEPTIGGEAAWRSFTAAAHRLDMKVISWFNPSYMWTEAPVFVAAQADARHYFKDKIDYELLPANSTARYFKWQKTCPGAPGQPVCPAWCRSESQCGGVNCRGNPCGGGNCSLYKGDHFIHSPAADACYYAVFADQPSGDWSRPEWRAYMRSVFQYWVNMGHDGFMLDWPQGYVGRNTSSTYGMPGCTGGDGKRNTCDPTIIEAIKSFVEPLGDIAVMGEAYNDVNTNWPFLETLDGVIDGSFGSLRFPVVGAEAPPTTAEIETALAFSDNLTKRSMTIVGRTEIVTGGPKLAGITAAENCLQAAFGALLGGYYALQATGGAKVSNGDYGDFGTWAGEEELGNVLRAVHADPALHPGSLRRPLPVKGVSERVYAALRTSVFGDRVRNHTVVIFNFDPGEVELLVNLSGTEVPIGQAPVNEIETGSALAPVPTSMQWPTRLRGYGYAAFAFGGARGMSG